MKRSAIKQMMSITITAVILNLPLNQAAAVSMDDMINEYTSSTVDPNSRASLDGRRGFISGGSLRVRFNNKANPDLYNITLPSFKAGCNGMDMNLGSLSWISADEFVDAARAMASPGVLVYALSLALNQMCGPCAQKMSELQDTLNKYSQKLKGSCEQIGTALYEFNDMDKKAAELQDWFWKDASDSTGNDAAETEGNVTQDMLDTGQHDKLSGNLVWKHMDGMTINGWLAHVMGENVAKELIMTLSGTDITDATSAGTDESKIDHDPKPPLPISLLDIIEGGEIEGLKCHDSPSPYDKCLDVREGVLFDLDPMAKEFYKYLDQDDNLSIVNKYAIHRDSVKLEPEQTAFLMAAGRHVDIMKTLHALGMSNNAMPSRHAEILSELMAIEIALHFMLEYVDTAVKVLSALDGKAKLEPINPYSLKADYREQADSLRKKLSESIEADANLSTALKNALDL